MNTRAKRASAVLLLLPFRGIPSPDGSVDYVDRALLAYVYGGMQIFAAKLSRVVIFPRLLASLATEGKYSGRTGSEPKYAGEVGL